MTIKYTTYEEAEEVNRIRAREYYKQHKEERKAYEKQYYQKNREKILERKKNARKQNNKLITTTKHGVQLEIVNTAPSIFIDLSEIERLLNNAVIVDPNSYSSN